MAIIKNVEIHYAKLNPKFPNRKFDKENPTWEIQIRTKDKDQLTEWKALGFTPKPVLDEAGERVEYYKFLLKRKINKKNGEPNPPVEVVNGKLEPVDPDTIGNGSVANVRIYQYTYGEKDEKIATILQGVQLTKHVYREPRVGGFEEDDTETIMPDRSGDDGANKPQVDEDGQY